VPKATKRERQRQNRELRREAMLAAERRRKRWRTARALAIPLIIVVVIGVIVAITSGGGDDDSSSASAGAVTCSGRKPSTPAKEQSFPEAPPLTIDVDQPQSVVMHTSCGDIDVKLDAQQAPQTVNSFLYLVENQFYNGTTFHRIVTDFVDQGGDPKGDGTGGPGYSLPDEPPKDGYKVGDVAMANSGPGTTGSQFFLVVSKKGAQTLNGSGAPYKYSILGRMDAHGLKVAKKINTFGSPNEAGTPTKTIYVFDIGIVLPAGATTTTAPATTTTPPTTTAAP
jgi:cyclophilin family peptidyl-prolyl cis-trans isomerase